MKPTYPATQLTVILPAFNEVRTIANTLQEWMDYLTARGITFEIIVAADGEDGTRERAALFSRDCSRVKVIGNKRRLGKGKAIRDAVAISSGEVVGFADADNKVPIQEIENLLPFFAQGYPIVIGSRALSKSVIERRQPLYRQLGGRGFHWICKLIVSLNVSDSQCGFKFFLRDTIADLFARQRIDGYMFDVEILFLARRLGYAIKEVPIRWRDDGDSRLDLIAGNIQNLKDLFRIRRLHKHLQR